MDERDFWALAAMVGVLAAISIMHSKVLGKMIDDTRDLRADVNWLKDNTVAHETEARP
jgi:hypothetical protein